MRAAIADAIAQTTGAERDRAHCVEILESLSVEVRASSARLEAAETEHRALSGQLEAHGEREVALRAETADVEAAHRAARSGIRSLRRELARLSEQEGASAHALSALEARTARACSAAAAAADRVLRVSYKLTRDQTAQHGTE